MYERGQGLPKRAALAGKLYDRACAGGDPESCIHLAEMVEARRDPPVNARKVGELYQRACDLGAVRACGP